MNGAAVKDGAPGAVAKALRIDSDGPYVLFPDLDISPSKFPELSMIIEFYLESIPEGSKGWLLNHDNGGYDRALVLHDARFGGISHGVGYPAGPVYDTYTTPETGKWVQMVVTYRQGGECAVFVSNEKAPITHEGRNNNGLSSLTLGRVVPYKNHWCDCWIKGVSVYDKGLSDEEVDAIFGKFKEEIIVPSGEASDDESVDEGEETDESVDEGEDNVGNDTIQNVALGKPTCQSTTWPNYGGVASNAVNGKTTGKRKNANSTVTCTANDDASPWWEVDLTGLYNICKINIFNRDLATERYKLNNFTVEVLRGGQVVWSSGTQTEVPEPEAMIPIPGGIVADSVRISKTTKHLILAEVQVWGTKALIEGTGATIDDRRFAAGVYKFTTTAHAHSKGPGGWFLGTDRSTSSGVRNYASSWAFVHKNEKHATNWRVVAVPGKTDTFNIYNEAHPTSGTPAGWSLQSHGDSVGKRNEYSNKVCSHDKQSPPAEWKITPGTLPGAWKIRVAAGGPPRYDSQEGWSLCAWGSKGAPDRVRDSQSSWVCTHTPGVWEVEWILENY